MKNLFLILSAVVFGFQVQASKYQLNEASLEEAFSQSFDLTPQIGLIDAKSIAIELGMSQAIEEGSKQTVAAIVGIVSLFAGIGVFIPIHRFILGTGGKGVIIFFVYCGLGLVGFSPLLTMVDCIFLLIDDTKNAYIGSGEILMWAGNL
ncbi:hypothetical protein N8Z47_00215 [Salibacteraceae bacterium]|nr:hypothetical protein [Salibacteraceae bacterium]